MSVSALRLLSASIRTPAFYTLVLTCLLPSLGGAQAITSARYTDPTTRYAHGVLGDAIEYGALELTQPSGPPLRIRLPQSDVFEDIAPRLVDLNGDGAIEIITVQSNAHLGAKLAVYDASGLVADTPNIGTRNRWLAPLGAADLDGDGTQDIAYIDRPHLAKTLRIWRFQDNKLTEIAALEGYTNHRIGERDIAGGIRTCNGTPEMILATADWSTLVAITFRNGLFKRAKIGSDTSRDAFAKAMTCLS